MDSYAVYREDVGGVSPPTGGVWGVTPRNFLKINPSYLQSGALCGIFYAILKGYFF